MKGALDDIVRLMPSEARWLAERDMLTFQAQMELKTDRATAAATLSRLFWVDPNYKPDTSVYPPSFQRFADDVRKAAKKLPTNRLDIDLSPPGRPTFVGGKPVGAAPLSLRLPAGDYRVEVDWGYRGLSRTVTVPAPPTPTKTVELAAAVEGAVAPDGGPCVEPVPEMATALARLLPLLHAGKIYGVRTLNWGAGRYASVTEVTAEGNQLQTARVKLLAGSPESEAFATLAAFFQTGHPAPQVEVLPKGDTDVPPPIVTVSSAPKPTPAAAPVSHPNTGLQIAGWVVGGVGLLGVGVGVAAFISANDAKNSLSAKQVNGAFPPNYQSEFASANNTIKSRQTLAVVAGGIGLAALATGVVLLVVGGHGTTSVSVAPSLIPGGGGALVAGSF